MNDGKTRRAVPAPPVTAETAPFWEAAAGGRLLIKRCNACARPYWYPRALCPYCLSEDTAWMVSAGRGEIYSFSVNRRAPQVYAIAYVRLAEGVTVLTNILDCDADTLRIGQVVRVVFKPSDGGPPVPMFKPV